MKITETIERDCCNYSDLKTYKGIGYNKNARYSVLFCPHCGQIWHYIRKPGEMDYGYEKADISKCLNI